MGCRGYPFACGGGSMAMAPHSSETVIARAPTIMAALFWRFWPERDVGGFCCPADETLKIATTKKIHGLVWGAVQISVLSGNGPTRHSIRHNLSNPQSLSAVSQTKYPRRSPERRGNRHKNTKWSYCWRRAGMGTGMLKVVAPAPIPF